MAPARVAVLFAVLMLAGCNAPSAPVATTIPSSASATTATTTPVFPTLVAGTIPAAGTPFEIHQYEEPTDVPRADLVRVTSQSEWSLHVVGLPGAVKANARVLVEELGSGRGALARADSDGSFAVDVVGAQGAWVRVARVSDALPPGRTLVEIGTKVEHLLGSTYVRALATPWSALAPGERAVWATGHRPFSSPWRFEGGVTNEADEIRLRGIFTIESAPESEYALHALATRAFDAQGEPLFDLQQFATNRRTPSLFPWEALTRQAEPTLSAPNFCEGASCEVDVRVPMTAQPSGGFVVRLVVPLAGPSGLHEGNQPSDMGAMNGRAYDPNANGWALTLLNRGVEKPFRLATLLLADAPAQGERGVQADGDAWGWTGGIVTQPPLHVTPRVDATGKPIRYTLEAYVPQVALSDREAPAPPFVPLLAPGGNWSLDIEDPSGAKTRLGPASIQSIVSRTATTSAFEPANNGGYNVDGIARLDTRDDAFRHAFTRDGLHSLVARGDARDADGNKFEIVGTFRVLVAEPLDLDLGMLPGTPLEVGAYVDRAIQTRPAVPADISHRFRLWAGAPAKLVLDETTTGKASEFGWFHPHAGHAVRPPQEGEYRVDVFANFTDSSGKLWSATMSFGGVVVNASNALDVRGRKGIDVGEQDKARFARSETGIPLGGTHFNFPYHSGDVAWQSDDDAMNVMATLGRDEGQVARAGNVSRLFARSVPEGLAESHDSGDVAGRFADGQGPFFSDGDFESYYYAAVEKPGVRVRETAREDYYQRPYWRFEEEPYSLQPGMGPDGDRENDYKFLFAGGVLRDAARGVAKTGAYAALWIDIGKSGESFVGSPFDRALLPGVRAFYDPTGTRSGSLLVRGDVADFGGFVAPLGAHNVFLNVTSPSGNVKSFAGTANAWGFLHDPAMNFVVDEPGVWSVQVRVAAGALEGGLNTGKSSYKFYVASENAARLPFAAPAFLKTGPFDYALAGLRPGGHATAWMPGWELESRPLAPGESVVRYHPDEFARKFPNFDPEGYARGLPADQVSLTAIAQDPEGAWRGLALDAWGSRLLAPTASP